MVDDELQDEAFAQSLPSPLGTPYQHSIDSLSRTSSRYEPSSPGLPSSPPMQDDNVNSDGTSYDSISPLDPRRFTPTLHANLVSEILSLRRELDGKHRFIEDLETVLEETKQENDSLNAKLSHNSKEERSMKHQLQLLESGTVSALEELAKERDEATDANADLRQRLEATEKKLKSQEDDFERTQVLWEKERDEWRSEKRTLEHRVHVTESRLKIIIEELAAREKMAQDDLPDSGDEDDKANGAGNGSETSSIRTMSRRGSIRSIRHKRDTSNSSYRSVGRPYRFSVLSGTGSEGPGRLGVTLADELAFDEEEEVHQEVQEEEGDDWDLDSDDFSEHELRALRALESRQSARHDEKAKRILGLTMGPQTPTSHEDDRASLFDASMLTDKTSVSGETSTLRDASASPYTVPPKRDYVDTGVQFSPPASPRLRPVSPVKPAESSHSPDVEANQRRKRVTIFSSSNFFKQQPKPSAAMVSASSQTVNEPLSPPETPGVPPSLPQESQLTPSTPQSTSVSTQTDPSEQVTRTSASLHSPQSTASPPSPTRAPPPVPISVPSIAIHPPTSTPHSPKEAVLPPGTKNAWSQTSLTFSLSVRSIAVQTEEIRIDKRTIKLPPHLLPSAISSKPGTPENDRDKLKENASPSKGALEDPIVIVSRSKPPHTATLSSPIKDRYPGNNDNGPLSSDAMDILRRPFRTSSLFAGFDGASSEEDGSEADLTDNDILSPQYRRPAPHSRGMKHSRPLKKPPTPVPEEKETNHESISPKDDEITQSRAMSTSGPSLDGDSSVSKAKKTTSTSREPCMRRSAMIHSGTAAHQGHSVNQTAQPPFPVPTRSSSRQTPHSKSEGSQSPSPNSGNRFSGSRGQTRSQQARKPSLRKVRSAAVMPRQQARPRSRSPPVPASPQIPQSPPVPPLPTEGGYGVHHIRRGGHRSQPSSVTSYTGNGSVASSAQQSSVVDAIAATMVGEWMWKYVRKRTAFGPPDSPNELARSGDEHSSAYNTNGVRHKRWVWLSPYERCIMWSSKQPTSGPALLGKSGRKLMIQSVLDVPDTTPLPRSAGVQPLFNRSILILTPARALKFTAVSRDRHYLWLTALSFLSHSANTAPDIGTLPPVPSNRPDISPATGGRSLRRGALQDSIRVAKDRARPYSPRAYSGNTITSPQRYNPVEEEEDAADPPNVPRFATHNRKRSMSGPKVVSPGQGFRSYAHHHAPSNNTTFSDPSHPHNMPPSAPSSVYNPSSVRTSEASSSARHNFFDAMGTVRMEAFVEPTLQEDAAFLPGVAPLVHGRSKPPGRPRRGDSSPWSAGTTDERRHRYAHDDFLSEDGEENNADAFRGF